MDPCTQGSKGSFCMDLKDHCMPAGSLQELWGSLQDPGESSQGPECSFQGLAGSLWFPCRHLQDLCKNFEVLENLHKDLNVPCRDLKDLKIHKPEGSLQELERSYLARILQILKDPCRDLNEGTSQGLKRSLKSPTISFRKWMKIFIQDPHQDPQRS